MNSSFKEKILVFTPTYNEVAHVETVVSQLNDLKLNLDILFLDDNSPDGTGQIIDKIVKKNTNVSVIHRTKKSGIGSAHLEGIRWAYARGYKYLITMDCDFAHSPHYFFEFFEYIDDYDVVVGSRHCSPEGTKGWNPIRKALTHTAHTLLTVLLGLPYDATIAFRMYRLGRIPLEVFEKVESKGYSFFFESLYLLKVNGYRITEFSIHMPMRIHGSSKMSLKEMFNSFKRLLQVYSKSLVNKKSFLCTHK